MAAPSESEFYRWQQQYLHLFCHLQANASHNEFCGCHNQRLKIRICAPPLDGKANIQLIKFIAHHFGVSKSSVRIVSGELNKYKNLLIQQPKLLPEKLHINRGNNQ